jgi:uncharacterized membrane protein
MKWNNILHIISAIGCIGGIIGMYSNGWLIWQWPAIALLWVISSYINAWSAHRANRDVETLYKEKLDMIEELTKSDMRAWEAEWKLAKANKK